jgi:dextranase
LGRGRDAAALVARDVRAHGDLVELLPAAPGFRPGEPIAIELRDVQAGELVAWRLDEVAASVPVGQDTLVVLPPLPEGGYLVEAGERGVVVATTAVDVRADPLSRPRYGFVADFAAGRDVEPVVENARRLHLNAIQFYDWMYRHAALVPPQEEFDDPLGRRLSLATVRRLANELAGAGALPLGYAAAYAVGRDEWPQWREAGLYRPDGTPWTLGEDFLWIVDPSDPRWLEHFARELRQATHAVGFAGFHLDQYGAPKRALRSDGGGVDLAVAFPRLIESVHAALPESRLIFNNVNNFPTWSTAAAPQDATYIEVWPPHTRLDHLAGLVHDARALARKPVILAAYLSVFAEAPENMALDAARLVMATVFSHGGSHLLAGEDGALLTDPYYPRNHRASAEALDVLRRWYDFAVAYGDLLFDDVQDVTRSLVGGVNEDLYVHGDVPVSVDAEPGSVWVRAVETPDGLAVHLIDLTQATELAWDAPKHAAVTRADTRLELLARAGAVRVSVASPETLPRLTPVDVRAEGLYATAVLPPWQTWALVLVRDA